MGVVESLNFLSVLVSGSIREFLVIKVHFFPLSIMYAYLPRVGRVIFFSSEFSLPKIFVGATGV